MNERNSTLISFSMTIAIFVLLEITTTTIFPLIGLAALRFSVFPLVVLFLSFYRNTNMIALLIILFSYVHGIFSVEVWYLSAFIGIVVSIVIAYFSDLIHLSNRLVTMFFAFIFQVVMITLRSFVFYLRGDGWEFILKSITNQVFEIIILSILSSFAFDFLSLIWDTKVESMEEFN